MTGWSALLLAAGVVAPHLLPLGRLRPWAAATTCLAALLLRAIVAVWLVLMLILYLPTTELFTMLTGWCWHAGVPLLTAHMELSGHELGDAARVGPLVAMLASLGSLTWAIGHAARTVRRMLVRRSIGRGPHGSVIVGGRRVLVAAAGLSHPQVIVSAGALTALDDAELAAGVQHERGHIERSHRFAVLAAQLARTIARLLPGTDRMYVELLFQLERDADAFALARRHDPLDLASAICKAAELGPAQASLLGLAHGGVRARVERLAERPPEPSRALDVAGRTLAVAMVTLVVGVAAALPATASTGVHELRSAPPAPTCQN